MYAYHPAAALAAKCEHAVNALAGADCRPVPGCLCKFLGYSPMLFYGFLMVAIASCA